MASSAYEDRNEVRYHVDGHRQVPQQQPQPPADPTGQRLFTGQAADQTHHVGYQPQGGSQRGFFRHRSPQDHEEHHPHQQQATDNRQRNVPPHDPSLSAVKAFGVENVRPTHPGTSPGWFVSA